MRLPQTYRGSEALLEPLQNNLTLVLIGECITSVKNGVGMIRMLNFKPHPVTLKQNLLVASIIFPDSVSSITPFKNDNQEKRENPQTLKNHQ